MTLETAITKKSDYCRIRDNHCALVCHGGLVDYFRRKINAAVEACERTNPTNLERRLVLNEN